MLSLLKQYLAQVETFGRVAFQTRPFETAGGTQYPEVGLLNERQASFLIGLMRNTPEVVDSKLRMAHEFWRMGEALANRDRTLLAQRILLKQREGKSAELARIGSGLMLDRRRALPGLNADRDVLRCAMEPGLFPAELDMAIDAKAKKALGPAAPQAWPSCPAPILKLQ